MKNINEKTFKKWAIRLLGVGAILFLCYGISVTAFHLTVCGERDRVGLDYAIFIDLCPKEAEQWYEELYWEECAKNDMELPPNTELLISACTNPEVRGVPGGEVLFVHEQKTGEVYLLDLRTGKKIPIPNDPLLLEGGIFLSSELVWLEGAYGGSSQPDYQPQYLLNITTGKRHELVDITKWDVKPEPLSDYAPYFQSAEQIFLHHQENRAIALPPDFTDSSSGGVILYMSQPDTKNGQVLETFLKDLKVDYEVIDLSLRYTEVPSPTGKYIASEDGIFLSGESNPLIPSEYTSSYYGHSGRSFIRSFISWYYDESGFVFTQGEYYYIYDSLIGSHFPLPRPILKLNIPLQ